MRNKGAKLAGLFFAFLICGSVAHAGTMKIAIAVTPKKENGEKKRSSNVTKEEILYQYVVKLSNSSFAPLTGLTAQYRVFIRDDSGKGAVSQQKLKRQEFSTAIPDLPNLGTYSFDTEPVNLEKATLDGGWIYTNGHRN